MYKYMFVYNYINCCQLSTVNCQRNFKLTPDSLFNHCLTKGDELLPQTQTF